MIAPRAETRQVTVSGAAGAAAGPRHQSAQPRQLSVVPAEIGGGVFVQGHDLLDGVPGGWPVLPGLRQGFRHSGEQFRDRCAEAGQAPW